MVEGLHCLPVGFQGIKQSLPEPLGRAGLAPLRQFGPAAVFLHAPQLASQKLQFITRAFFYFPDAILFPPESPMVAIPEWPANCAYLAVIFARFMGRLFVYWHDKQGTTSVESGQFSEINYSTDVTFPK